ncbi:MAG: prephenate dehydrogenase/arogenate dehydrogenase family protein, partial [Planctomycetota bacterium]
MLAIPVAVFEDALATIAPVLEPGTLVVDVASVKVRPIELMLGALPQHCRVIGAHPLFGPQTAAEVGLSGQTVAVCPAR